MYEVLLMYSFDTHYLAGDLEPNKYRDALKEMTELSKGLRNLFLMQEFLGLENTIESGEYFCERANKIVLKMMVDYPTTENDKLVVLAIIKLRREILEEWNVPVVFA